MKIEQTKQKLHLFHPSSSVGPAKKKKKRSITKIETETIFEDTQNKTSEITFPREKG